MEHAEYPEIHWQRLRRYRRRALVVLGVVVGVGGMLFYRVLWGRSPDDLGLAAAWWVPGGLVATSFVSVWYCAARWVSVHPYFERRVGGISTFASGYAVARHLPWLDKAADARRVPRLSSFGWNDDWRGEELAWHTPESGREVIGCLLEALPERFAPGHVLYEELGAMGQALEAAEAKQIRWCLLLRHANATNGLEWEQREGSAC